MHEYCILLPYYTIDIYILSAYMVIYLLRHVSKLCKFTIDLGAFSHLESWVRCNSNSTWFLHYFYIITLLQWDILFLLLFSFASSSAAELLTFAYFLQRGLGGEENCRSLKGHIYLLPASLGSDYTSSMGYMQITLIYWWGK